MTQPGIRDVQNTKFSVTVRHSFETDVFLLSSSWAKEAVRGYKKSVVPATVHCLQADFNFSTPKLLRRLESEAVEEAVPPVRRLTYVRPRSFPVKLVRRRFPSSPLCRLDADG